MPNNVTHDGDVRWRYGSNGNIVDALVNLAAWGVTSVTMTLAEATTAAGVAGVPAVIDISVSIFPPPPATTLDKTTPLTALYRDGTLDRLTLDRTAFGLGGLEWEHDDARDAAAALVVPAAP